MNKQITDNINPKLDMMPCELDAGYGTLAKMGLIVLQSDQTIEHEFSTILQSLENSQNFSDGSIALYHSRIANFDDVTPENLKSMEQQMPIAAALLNQDFNYDVVGYACTSGATMIGEEKITRIIQAHHSKAKASNPITACKAALTALNVKNMALLTPYPPEVTLAMQENLQNAGFHTASVHSFYQAKDSLVARITSESILKAILQIGKKDTIDAVFVSCTSLRVLKIIAEAEAILNKPVLSSNQVMAWHMLRVANIKASAEKGGMLFKH